MSRSGEDFLYTDFYKHEIDEAMSHPIMQNILPDMEKMDPLEPNASATFSNVCDDTNEHLQAINPNELFYQQDDEEGILGASAQITYTNVEYGDYGTTTTTVDTPLYQDLSYPPYSTSQIPTTTDNMFGDSFQSMSLSHNSPNSLDTPSYSLFNGEINEGASCSNQQEQQVLAPLNSSPFSESCLSPYSGEASPYYEGSTAASTPSSVSSSSSQSPFYSTNERLSPKPKKGSRGRPRTSSSSTSASHTRAARQRLDHLTEEQKKDRIRVQNNEASQRYREKRSKVVIKLDGLVREEEKRTEQLEMTRREALLKIEVLSRSNETISSNRLDRL